MRRLATSLALALGCLLAAGGGTASALPPIKHVWIVVLENKDYAKTFAADSQAPYLAKTLPSKGQLLTQYYGTGHFSLDNYITMVSGQPPNPVTQSDCQIYQDFAGAIGPDGVALGHGCVYPAGVKTIADQLEAKGLTWKGYMEDMGTGCRHPALNSQDETQTATKDSQYAARHNPFVYFHSIIDRPACAKNDVDLGKLPADLGSASKTPSYSFITPDLCSDGHDEPCVDGRPGGLKSINTFLEQWIPRITTSPAYADGGLVIVTFDEAENDDASDCCNEPTGPNTPNNGGITQGNGGGRIGAVLLSPYVKPGTTNDTPYNHYSLLRSIEDMFGLDHLAYAARDGLKPFGDDVFGAPAGNGFKGGDPAGGGGGGGGSGGGGGGGSGSGSYPAPRVSVSGVPPLPGCVSRAFKPRVRVHSKHLRNVNSMVDRRSLVRGPHKRFRVTVRVAGLRAGYHRFTVRARDQRLRVARETAVFRVCP